jgi:hypothetical protein
MGEGLRPCVGISVARATFNQAIVNTREKCRSLGCLAGAEGSIQWVMQHLARFASRPIPNFASKSSEPRSPPMLGCYSRASWTNVSALMF